MSDVFTIRLTSDNRFLFLNYINHPWNTAAFFVYKLNLTWSGDTIVAVQPQLVNQVQNLTNPNPVGTILFALARVT